MLKHRRYLMVTAAENLIPSFARIPVTIKDYPGGRLATPVVDSLCVVKAAIGFRSRRILEIGRKEGITARTIAENTPEFTDVWVLDQDPEHGSACQGMSVEKRIHRIGGKDTWGLVQPHGPFDLVFLAAGQDYETVYRNSSHAFRLLSEHGVILWAGYQHKDYFHGLCAVPEALHVVGQTFCKRIIAIEGTTLAIYSNHPGWETCKAALDAPVEAESNPWRDERMHGL